MHPSAVRWTVACVTLAGALVALPAAAKDPVLVTLARWQKGSNNDQVLAIALTEQLSKRQKDLINSGFSTHSELEIKSVSKSDNSEVVITSSQCTVKFDTWEEIYDIARVDKDFATLTAKSFDSYAANCLTAQLPASQAIGLTMDSSRFLRATLKVNQITTEKAAKIREWLIKQQSGVMQGLFSHMLGELQLFESITVAVHIPPRSADISRSKAFGLAPQPAVAQ